MKKQVVFLLFVFCFMFVSAYAVESPANQVMIGGNMVNMAATVASISTQITVITWSKTANMALPCGISYYDYYKEGGITHQSGVTEVGSTTMRSSGKIVFNVVKGKCYKVVATKGAGMVWTKDLGLVNGPKTVKFEI
jgi:hypothetical protein